MCFSVLLTQLLVKCNRLHHRACRADWPCQIAHNRHILCLFFQDTDCIQRNLRPAFRHIHRPQFLQLTYGLNHISGHMGLVHRSPHIYLCAHLLRLYGHAEGNSIILETSLFINSFRQFCHLSCIPVRLRHIDLHPIHQLGSHHIHHSAGADTGRSVRLLPR